MQSVKREKKNIQLHFFFSTYYWEFDPFSETIKTAALLTGPRIVKTYKSFTAAQVPTI